MNWPGNGDKKIDFRAALRGYRLSPDCSGYAMLKRRFAVLQWHLSVKQDKCSCGQTSFASKNPFPVNYKITLC